MSKYFEKVSQGLAPTDEDWAEHLLEAHRKSPSMTPKVFAPYQTQDGMSSYEVLAQSLKSKEASAAVVLDLACGDGFLVPLILSHLSESGRVVGLDMSEAELAVAREALQDPRVEFVQASAQHMPVKSETFDFVLCHMALMLMLPIEPVVHELRRVLKKAGQFAAVISNPNFKDGLLQDIFNVVFEKIYEGYPNWQKARSGDPRVLSDKGLRELFNSGSGFMVQDIQDFQLLVQTDADGVWQMMKDLYFIGMLPDRERQLGECKLFCVTG